MSGGNPKDYNRLSTHRLYCATNTLQCYTSMKFETIKIVFVLNIQLTAMHVHTQ